MGIPATPSAHAYRDEPEEADAVSMHTTSSNYEYYDVPELPELPSYTDSEAAAASSSRVTNVNEAISQPTSGVDPYPRMKPLSGWRHTSHGKVQNINETTVRMDARLDDPDKLEMYIKNYVAVVPPRSRIRLVGSHQETRYNSSSKKNEEHRVTDFDISFSLDSYFTRERGFWSASAAENGDNVHRGSFRKTRAEGYRGDIEIADSEISSLQDWCRDFCNNKSALKVFRIKREIAGFETEYLRNNLNSLIRSTQYRGHLDISFPIEEKNIDIYSPHWVNKWRLSWIRWIFYLTFLWIIIWPILFFMTKRWSTYTVFWCWSISHHDEEQQVVRKVYASMSEKDWIKRHKNLVLSLALERFQDDATQLPTDVPDERVIQSAKARMPSSSNSNGDGVANLIHSVGIWNAVQGRNNGDMNAWGVDS